VRLSDGTELWKYPAKPDSKTSFYATPDIMDDGRLVIGSAGTDHCLYVIDTTKVDAASGTPEATCIFNGAADRWIAAPLIVENVAYAPNNDGSLYAVDLASNKLLWSLKIGGGGHLWGTPSSDGKLLYISSLDHHVYAVDIASHQIVWGQETDLKGSVIGSPALSEDGATVYVGSFDKKIYALDAATGKLKWSQPVPTGDWVWGSPLVNAGTVYVGDLAGNLYALDAATGSVTWSVKPDGPITGGPMLAGDKIVVTTESGTVYAYDAQGKPAWNASVKGKIYTPAVQAGDLILVAPLSSGAEFLLTALGSNGSVVWNYPPKSK
jgi:outer membrane protein assembly factor BamB